MLDPTNSHCAMEGRKRGIVDTVYRGLYTYSYSAAWGSDLERKTRGRQLDSK